MANATDLSGALFDYIAGRAPKPDWLDSLNANTATRQLYNFVTSSRESYRTGLSNPAAALGQTQSMLTNMINQVYPNNAETGLAVGPRSSDTFTPPALPQDPDNPYLHIAPTRGIGDYAGPPLSNGSTQPGFGGPTPTIPNPTGQPLNLTNEQKSAKASIEDTLGQYGLSGLADTVWQSYLTGTPINQIMLDIRNTPEYKSRFPAMATLSQKGRAISEQQYIDWERSAAQVAKQAGLPPSFYDQPDDFAKFIANDVSIKEFSDRVQMASEAAMSVAPQVQQQLSTLYGADTTLAGALNPGTLTAFFLDPDKAEPIIQKQYNAAKLGAQSQLSGYGQLSANTLENLATQGVTEQQAGQGFGQLAGMNELFNSMPGENTDQIGQDEQLGAVFSNNAAAQERIRRRQAQRKATFQSGGGFGNTGSGLGTAS